MRDIWKFNRVRTPNPLLAPSMTCVDPEDDEAIFDLGVQISLVLVSMLCLLDEAVGIPHPPSRSEPDGFFLHMQHSFGAHCY